MSLVRTSFTAIVVIYMYNIPILLIAIVSPKNFLHFKSKYDSLADARKCEYFNMLELK